MSEASDIAALAEYKAARTKILKSQSYSTGDKSSQRAMLKDVEAAIEKYQNRVDAATESNGGISMTAVTIDD